MKRFRFYFWGLFFGFLLALIYSGDKFFFIGVSVMGVITLYSLISIFWIGRGFNYLHKITPSHVKKGEKTILTIQIHNDTPFIFPYIKVYYRTPDSLIKDQEKEYIRSILPFQHKTIEEEIICNLKGEFPIGITKVEIKDIFGLFTFSVNLINKSYYKPLVLQVWPRVLKLLHLPIPLMEQGTNTNRSFISTHEFSNPTDTRSYRPGDTLKKIHWKLSSKLQDIQVKNYETGTQPENLLFIETTPISPEGLLSYKVEDQIIECSIAVIHHILSKWHSLEVIYYDTKRQHLIGRDAHDFERFYNHVGFLPFNSIFPMDSIIQMESPHINQGCSIILIIHNLSHDLFNLLYQYKQSGIFAMVLFIQPYQETEESTKEMLEQLNEKGVPSIVVNTEQRLDKILEAWV